MPRMADGVDQRLLAAMRHPDLRRAAPRRASRSARPSRHGRRSPAAARRRATWRAGAPASSPRPGTPPDRPAAAPSDRRWRRAAPARSRPPARPCAGHGRRPQIAERDARAARRPRTAAPARRADRSAASQPASPQQRDQPLAFAQRVAADDMGALRETAPRWPAAGRSRAPAGGWRNTGSAKVASVTNTSHGDRHERRHRSDPAGACSRR